MFVTVSFLVANSTYVFARIATIALTCVVFLYGLRKQEFKFDYATGNFNTPAVQFSAAFIILLFQGYLLYFFIAKQIKRARENAAPVVVKTKPKQKPKKREGVKTVLHLLLYIIICYWFYFYYLYQNLFY